MIYASIFDYSILSQLTLMITKVNPERISNIDWAVESISGRYHSYIEPVSLTKGSYFLTIKSNSKIINVKFSLDLLYESESGSSDYFQNYFTNMLELCGNFGSLPRSLNSVEYIHPLSGN